MVKKTMSIFVILIMMLNTNMLAFADGSSTPPTYEQRVNRTRESAENNSSVDTENDSDDYESKISRPVVDNTEYEAINEPKRPERPIVDLTENDNGSTNTKPTRPIVDTTTDYEDDIGTNSSQMSSSPTVDTGGVSSPNMPDRPSVDTTNNHSQQIEDTKSIDYNFFDVSENHSNYQAICSLAKKNIISGDGSGYFRPNDYITRAEFVKIICSAFNLKMKSNTKIFNDVNSHWAKDFIYIAASNGLISGVSENEFAPNDNITYQQISKIIVTLKGWENNAIKLGSYPDGYVKVMINNSLFEKSAVDTNYFKSSSYYNSKSSRADVAQIVYNALLYNSADKTIIDEPTEQTTVSQPATVTTVTPYIVTSDLGESVTGTDNPTPQQIYNYVYNRIKDREVYQKDPNVLNAIMAMIWKESGGKHYENGNIKCNSNSSSKDYGICQLNDSVFSNAKYWGWRENLNAGIDKYATAYWMCMGEETKYNIYLQSVEKALRGNYAQTYQEARARTAYCMYNSTNDGRERWFTEKDGRDTGFYNRYVNKEWAKTLIETGNQTPVDKLQVSQSSNDSKASTAKTVKYDGKSYTYIKNSKTYKIATKSYSTDDFANIQDVWKIFYGYNPTLYNDNPLYGRLEWYCEGIGSLCVEYDMRNVSDDNIYQFDIYRFTQNGNKFILPTEYIGYGKILSGKLTMTKHGNVAFIGIKNLANIIACDIDYKNQIKSNSTMQSNLQKVTDNRTQQTEIPAFYVEKKSKPVVFSQTDNRWSEHKYGKTIGSSGCGLLSITNAVYYLNGQFINPKFSAEFSKSKGLIGSGGSSSSLYEEFAKSYGDKYGYKYIGATTKIEQGKTHLLNGGVTIVGTFAGKSSTHIMAVVDYRTASDGTDEFLVLDSAKSSNRFNATYAWIKLEQPNNPIYKKVGSTTYTYYSHCYYNNKEICFGNFRLFETTNNSQIKIQSNNLNDGGWFDPTKDFSIWWNTDSNLYYRYSIASMQFVGLTGMNNIDSYDSSVTYEADRLYLNCGIYKNNDKVLFNTDSGIMFPADTFQSGAAYKIWVGQYDGADKNAKLLKHGYIYIFAQ